MLPLISEDANASVKPRVVLFLVMCAISITFIAVLALMNRQIFYSPSSWTILPTEHLNERPWCPFGSLPGMWESSHLGGDANEDVKQQSGNSESTAGSHWKTFSQECTINNLLPSYTVRTRLERPPSSDSSDPNAEQSANVTLLDPDDPLSVKALKDKAAGSLSTLASASLPSVASMMFISDSVDRHIMTVLCEHCGGEIRAVVLRDSFGDSSTGGDACSSLGPTSPPRRLGGTSRGGFRKEDQKLSAANFSSCVVNTCSIPGGRLKLLATYIPGVHPTGPYHKGRKLGFMKRVDQAANVWSSYSEKAPNIVVISSSLWDIARLSAFEPKAVANEELPREVVQSWVQNYTRLVKYVVSKVPSAGIYVYHTTMLPRYDASSGEMLKSYLGRANFLRQLNAAGRHAAGLLGMEVVDYEVLSNRFLEGQTYLEDLIHPNEPMGLELANIYLNYVAFMDQQQEKRKRDKTKPLE